MTKETLLQIEFISDDSSMIPITDINSHINEKELEKYLLYNGKDALNQLILRLKSMELIINKIANKLHI